ncbi:MAG: LamG domain-containing protein, partial [Gammaproteobacteria bacterium]|nr:LamG domain-containing protein [Gammaproteobacteria bacterium]
MHKQELKIDMRALLMSVAAFLLLQFFSSPLIAAPGDVLFNDDFERVALGADWAVDNSGGGDAGIGTQTANSGSRSLYTRWQLVSVTSRSFDLSTISGAELAIWVRRGDDAFSEDPEVVGSEDLMVQYLDNVGSWQQLARYTGGGTPGQIFTPTFYLPADALHANFQIRFMQTGGDGSDWDYWHVDDVTLTENAGLPTFVFPFCDDFENGMNNWQVQDAGGDAGTGTFTFNSASNSLYLRWGVVSVTSFDIDLSTISTAYLNFWARRGADSFSEDPDTNENLSVEYFNNSGNWINLETFPGNGTNGEIFNRSFALPASAMHSGFKIRFSMTDGSGADFDYWHVDDVCVEGPPSAVALYHLDEASWGSVTDSSGNGNNAAVVGGVVPNSISPAVAGNPGTCGYADIPFNNSNNIYDAIDTGVDVDSDIGNTGSINFWYKSNVRWDGNNGDRQLLDASTTASGQKYFFLTLRNNSRLRFGLEDSNDGDFAIEGGNNNFNAEVWVHIAIVWDLPNDRLQLYVNGNLDTQNTFGTNGVMGNMDTLYLGDNRSTYQIGGMTGNSANGSIDEVHIYDFVLTQAEIQADMNSTHSCGSALDHFVLSHDGFGINCLAEVITATATQADSSTYTGYTGTIILDTQSGNGTWTLTTGNGSFTDATGGDGLATYTFDVTDNGVASFGLDYQSGVASIDVDTFEGTTRDDDTEGNLVFSP